MPLNETHRTAAKFIVVNNGMTESRGHYVETGLAIASEARRRGFDTSLAVHVRCDASGLLEDLPLYPVFRVDHWGMKIDPEASSLFGLRSDLKLLCETPIEAVLSREIGMERYLDARFVPLPPEVESVPARSTRRQAIKHQARRLLPPLALSMARFMVRRRWWAKACIRALTPPFILDWFKSKLRSRELPPAPPPPEPTFLIDLKADGHLKAALQVVPSGVREYEFARMFREDLERLMCLVDAGPEDHVFLPTAHGREAAAIRQLIHDIGPERSPTFHLEFRHAVSTPDELDANTGEPGTLIYSRVHQAFFDACRSFPDTDRVRFYADTSELAADYSALSGYEVGELPIPFRSNLIPPVSKQAGPLNILFLGDVREEKGFLRLPMLVRALFESHVRPGKVRFAIQGSLHRDEKGEALRAAVADLASYAPEHVDLFGHDGFVSAEDYYRLLAEADVVLCPYRADSYRARSSGVLAEAITAGKPVVVPAGTWLAHQVLPGSGEEFADDESLAEAVRKICDDYSSYRTRAAEARARWMAWHTTPNLLDQLFGRKATRAEAA